MSESNNEFIAKQLDDIADRIDQIAFHDKQIIQLSWELQAETSHLRTLAELIRKEQK